ncbi:MAG: iron chelate uptake ABC transporter family permease subunit [Actinomycetota bacterium]|nr:iron chelate uptake ABC transporter family permease subunit [Actinomycetota bacterium]
MTGTGKRTLRYVFILIALLLLLIIVSASIGAAKIPIKDTGLIISIFIPGIKNLIGEGVFNEQDMVIISMIRLPRIFLSVFVGIALAGSGVIFQGLFRNPMADPFVIGVSAGAAFGATIGLVIITGTGLGGISTTTVFALLGAVATTFLVYNIARIRGRVSVVTLLLSGIALSAMLSAITYLIMIFKAEDMAKIIFWVMGSFTSASWNKFIIMAPLVTVLVAISAFFMRDLNILSLGEERAAQLGVDTERVKKILMVMASLIAAVAVSMSGIIGFVGLVTPHILRLIVGPDHKILYPTSIIAGGIVLLLSDTLARTVLMPREIPVGIITSIIGVPFFLYLLIKSKRNVF